MTDENLPAVQAPEPPGPERPRVKVNLAQPLADLDEAYRLADALSRSDLVPASLQRKPSSILHVLMTGQALGLDWPTSLRVIYSPGAGQIALRGAFLLAQIRKAGHDYEWEEADTSCTFTIHRDARAEKPGRSYSVEFTIEDAIRAGLAKRNDEGVVVAMSKYGAPLPWQQYQPQMLFWRAVAKCVSRAAPEISLGFEIQGAEGPADPQPEVVLTPDTPAPAAGEAAPGGPEQVRSKLEELHAEMTTGLPPAPAPPPGVPARAGRSRKSARLEAGLSIGFSELGWDPASELANVLRACSMFARRKVTAVRDLSEDEMERLSQQIAVIAANPASEDAGPVFLAETVDRWEEDWQAADFDSHHMYEHDAEVQR